MNYTIVDICNMALAQIKVRQITSLQDSTNEAQQCRKNIDACITAVLSMANWSFAKVIRQLPMIAAANINAEFLSDRLAEKNIFAYPADIVRIRSVRYLEREIDRYDVISVKLKSEESFITVIVTDAPKIEIEYTRMADEVKLWSPLFVTTFVHYLAYTLAPLLSADSTAATTQLQLYYLTLKQAQAANTNEQKHIRKRDLSVFREVL